jgi:WD40 repeat protein
VQIERWLKAACTALIDQDRHSTTTPNLIFGKHLNIALVGYCLGDKEVIDWGLNDSGEPFGPHKGGFYPVMDTMIRDGHFWAEAPIYALVYDVHSMLALAEAARHYDGTDAPFLHHATANSLAWGDRGRLLAAGCRDGSIYVWDVPEHRLQAVLEGHQAPVTNLAFHPTCNLLASSSPDSITRLWDPVTGRRLLTAPGRCLHFSPDGSRLAFYHGRRLGIWAVAAAQECCLLHPGRRPAPNQKAKAGA